AGSDEQDRALRDQRDPGDQRHVERTLAIRPDRLREDGLGAAVELRALLRLLRERLDDVDADDVLLGDGRYVREPLLYVAQRRMRDVAVAIREHDEDRGDRQRDQRQLPLE